MLNYKKSLCSDRSINYIMFNLYKIININLLEKCSNITYITKCNGFSVALINHRIYFQTKS